MGGEHTGQGTIDIVSESIYRTSALTDEIFVAHFLFLVKRETLHAGEGTATVLKDAIHDHSCQRMAAISHEIVLTQQKVVVGVQLPKFAVQDVKVFVRKVRVDLTKAWGH